MQLDLSDKIIMGSGSLAAHKDRFTQHYHSDFAFNLDDHKGTDRKAI